MFPLVVGRYLVPVSSGHSVLVVNRLPRGLATWSLVAVSSLGSLGHSGLAVPGFLVARPFLLAHSVARGRRATPSTMHVVLSALPTVAGFLLAQARTHTILLKYIVNDGTA